MEKTGAYSGNVKVIAIVENYKVPVSVYFVYVGKVIPTPLVCHVLTERNASLLVSDELDNV
jgi:hypothetical protein